jgi:formate dehydrogenase gamma subunit
MEQRTVARFQKRAILVHWLNAVAFSVLMITGALMFFDLVSFGGGPLVRKIHQAAAVFFLLIPVSYSLVDPAGTMSFLQEAFRWDRDDLAWLRASPRLYFGRRLLMPPQGRINGDQKLWQLAVIVSGTVLALSGPALWLFRLKMPLALYHWVRLAHGSAFVVVSFMFAVHFYLRTLHPSFEESLASMLDGKVSPSYARDRYRKWYEQKQGNEGDSEKDSLTRS